MIKRTIAIIALCLLLVPPATTQPVTDLSVLQSILTAVQTAIPTGANVIGGIFGSPNVTATDCSVALTAGTTAQNIIAASATIHGFTVANIDSTTGSGEPVWISLTGAALAGAAGSYPLPPPAATSFAGMGSYTTPIGFGSNKAVSVVAATTGHKISCTVW